MKKKQIILLLFLLPLFVFMAEEHSSSDFLAFLGKSLNFIILFGGLAYLLSKPLRNYLQKRSLEIKQSLEEAENSRQEAEEKSKEAKAQLENLGEKITQIKKEAESTGQKEKGRIIKEAEREAERIKRLTQQEIEMLIEAGIQEIREYTFEMAAVLAQERIKKRMTLQDHSLLLDKCIERLSGLDENSVIDKKIHSRIS
jgi:F-type H+-transporting ATPase subunit b